MKTRRMIFSLTLVLFASITSIVWAQQTEPTYKEIRYSDKYERSVLDIWTVKSDKPAPLVVYFHGGGFRAGDKRLFNRSPFLKRFHPKGVAFATVNYPFLKHTNNDYAAIIEHTAKAIEYLRDNAAKYNVDSNRVSVMGTSAGALISCYLGHGAETPVQSVFAHQQPMGTWILTIPSLKKNGPPIIVYNSSSPSDRVHHPDNATAVQKVCNKLGVTCEVYGTKRSGLPELPDGEDIHDAVMKLFYKSWKMTFPIEPR